jgi:hypothetical protein
MHLRRWKVCVGLDIAADVADMFATLITKNTLSKGAFVALFGAATLASKASPTTTNLD